MMHLMVTSRAEVEERDGLLLRSFFAIVRLLGGDGAASRRSNQRHMQLVEILPLGAKKQLLLVTCDGERFLIGTGAESVQSILQVRGEADVAREVVR